MSEDFLQSKQSDLQREGGERPPPLALKRRSNDESYRSHSPPMLPLLRSSDSGRELMNAYPLSHGIYMPITCQNV